MKQQLGAYGALLLALCLIGYVIYELILYPDAGFPIHRQSIPPPESTKIPGVVQVG